MRCATEDVSQTNKTFEFTVMWTDTFQKALCSTKAQIIHMQMIYRSIDDDHTNVYSWKSILLLHMSDFPLNHVWANISNSL